MVQELCFLQDMQQHRRLLAGPKKDEDIDKNMYSITQLFLY